MLMLHNTHIGLGVASLGLTDGTSAKGKSQDYAWSYPVLYQFYRNEQDWHSIQVWYHHSIMEELFYVLHDEQRFSMINCGDSQIKPYTKNISLIQYYLSTKGWNMLYGACAYAYPKHHSPLLRPLVEGESSGESKVALPLDENSARSNRVTAS